MIHRREFLKFAAFACAPLRAAAATGFTTQIATKVERAFRTPGAAPNGLQATPEGLWILDQATNRVALVDYKDGHVLRQFETETVLLGRQGWQRGFHSRFGATGLSAQTHGDGVSP